MSVYGVTNNLFSRCQGDGTLNMGIEQCKLHCSQIETSADAQHGLWQMAMCKNMYLFCPWPSCARMFTL